MRKLTTPIFFFPTLLPSMLEAQNSLEPKVSVFPSVPARIHNWLVIK